MHLVRIHNLWSSDEKFLPWPVRERPKTLSLQPLTKPLGGTLKESCDFLCLSYESVKQTEVVTMMAMTISLWGVVI